MPRFGATASLNRFFCAIFDERLFVSKTFGYPYDTCRFSLLDCEHAKPLHQEWNNAKWACQNKLFAKCCFGENPE